MYFDDGESRDDDDSLGDGVDDLEGRTLEERRGEYVAVFDDDLDPEEDISPLFVAIALEVNEFVGDADWEDDNVNDDALVREAVEDNDRVTVCSLEDDASSVAESENDEDTVDDAVYVICDSVA